MIGVPSNTSAESAAKIMGRACIRIEEVLKLFPEIRAWVYPEDYQTTPFSPRLLYYLSERKMGYVLFPAIPYYPKSGFECWPDNEQRTWTGFKIHNFFNQYLPEVSANQDALSLVATHALKRNFAPAKWYLISSRAIPRKDAPDHPPIGHSNYKIEGSLIYIYAWLLFWRLRGISLFEGKSLLCNDYFSNSGGVWTVLRFRDLEIFVGSSSKESRAYLSKAPSILPYDHFQP